MLTCLPGNWISSLYQRHKMQMTTLHLETTSRAYHMEELPIVEEDGHQALTTPKTEDGRAAGSQGRWYRLSSCAAASAPSLKLTDNPWYL